VSQAYEFRKLYADIVDESGSVAVLYLNYVRLAGIWTGRASVELYTPDGQRRLMHATEPAALTTAATRSWISGWFTMASRISGAPFE